VVVYCWHCGGREDRAATGLYAPCDKCRSTDVHVTASLQDSSTTRKDIAEAVARHRETASASR